MASDIDDLQIKILKRLVQSQSDLWNAKLYAEGLLQLGTVRENDGNKIGRVNNRIRIALESAIVTSYASAFKVLVDSSGNLVELPKKLVNHYSYTEKALHDALLNRKETVFSHTELDLSKITLTIKGETVSPSQVLGVISETILVTSNKELEAIMSMINKMREKIDSEIKKRARNIKDGRY